MLSGTAQIDERVGNPTAARIDGENITLSDLMEADGTAPISTKKERFKVSGTRATKKSTGSKKDQRDQGSESRSTTQTEGATGPKSGARVNNIDTSTTKINAKSEPTPQSGTAQNSSESIARQQCHESESATVYRTSC